MSEPASKSTVFARIRPFAARAEPIGRGSDHENLSIRNISQHALTWLARRETGDADVDATDERTLAKYKYLAVYGEDARDRADVEAPAAPA